MAIRNPQPTNIFTPGLIRKLEREYARLGKQETRIAQERARVKTILDNAKMLAATDQPQIVRRKVSKGRRTIPPSAKPKTDQIMLGLEKTESRQREGTWTATIANIVQRVGGPISYSDAKAEVMKTPLAERLQHSDKGFYGAIAKLDDAKTVIAYKGHLFTPVAFQKFEDDLRAGRVRDLKSPNKAHISPMGEATKEFMRNRPRGATSGNMIWELMKRPEFAAIITKNKTHPYNVFARLVKTGALVKRGKRYYATEMKNETPPGMNPEGASNDSGEGGSSPSESPRSAFSTVG